MSGTLTRSPGLTTGARFILSGKAPTGQTWHDDVVINDSGAVISGADTWEWRLTVRESYDDTIDLTLSTTNSELVISQGTSSTTIQIRAAATELSNLDGDYLVNIASKDGSGRIILWCSGIVTFIHEPVWS